MSASSPEVDGRRTGALSYGHYEVRLSTETKAAFKTTEFVAYVAVLVGVFIAGAVAKASGYAGRHDILRADRVWLYAVILTVGYMISRGLAKSGSRDYYSDHRDSTRDGR